MDTLDYRQLRKEFKEIQRRIKREDSLVSKEREEHQEYELRVKSACKSNYTGLYVNVK